MKTSMSRRQDIHNNQLAQYERMLEIREFEEQINALFAAGLVRGSTHLCQGQEALAVGLASVLRHTDVVAATYRGHGIALALGLTPESVLGEIMGKTNGCCGGVGGSMHMCDMEMGLLPTSAIVAKADNVCLIARKDDDHSINGSIHIIKEGEKNADLSAIMMTSEGNVRIAGNQIFIGRSTEDGGEGGGPGPDGSQPYVKYQQLEALLTNVINDVRTFCDTLLTHTTPGYGAPSLQINNAATALRAAMDARELEIPAVKSTRIFGE